MMFKNLKFNSCDKKTEALLIFIKITLKESFNQIDSKNSDFILENKKDREYINHILKVLFDNLEKTIMDFNYLISLMKNAHKNKTLKLIAEQKKPIFFYYNILVKTLENSLPTGSLWIPELIVISLLSEWILEKEKMTMQYPYLENIDYMDLITRYDNNKYKLDNEKKKIIMNMYKISSLLITKLEESEYAHKKS